MKTRPKLSRPSPTATTRCESGDHWRSFTAPLRHCASNLIGLRTIPRALLVRTPAAAAGRAPAGSPGAPLGVVERPDLDHARDVRGRAVGARRRDLCNLTHPCQPE